MIFQLVDITNLYLNFPYHVKLNVLDFNFIDLPSITFCLKRNDFWLKRYSNNSEKYFNFSLNCNNTEKLCETDFSEWNLK
jgi:hypothetical protein